MSLADLIPREPSPPDLVKAAQLAAWLHVSVKTIYLWSAEGKLPPPIRVGPRTTLYRVKDVLVALEGKDRPASRKRKGAKNG